MTQGFFGDYPKFFETSETMPLADRLNARYLAIIDRNRSLLSGKKVLDIASHDGRWTFAAIKAGAAHVLGIEARQYLIDHARKTFAHYGVGPEQFEFVQGDVFEVLRRTIRVDTVLCLGFLYHTIRHAELIHLISTTRATSIILDTEIVPRAASQPQARRGLGGLFRGKSKSEPAPSDSRLVWNNPFAIQLLKDPVTVERMAVKDELTRHGETLVGRPTAEAVEFILDHFGYELEEIDWKPYLRGDTEAIRDYEQGWRTTFVARSRADAVSRTGGSSVSD